MNTFNYFVGRKNIETSISFAFFSVSLQPIHSQVIIMYLIIYFARIFMPFLFSKSPKCTIDRLKSISLYSIVLNFRSYLMEADSYSNNHTEIHDRIFDFREMKAYFIY